MSEFVWVVEEEFLWYDGGDVIRSVHSSLDSANDWIRKQQNPNDYMITMWKVEA